jgi:hypothetical protein
MSRNRFAVKTILRQIATSFLNAKPVGDDYFNRHNGSRRLAAWR